MSASTGRREAHKESTRAALREAGARLFAERGYEATTVRDIAQAAQVTERTFYRYFDGKEGLRAEQTLGWIELLHDAILDRPAQEPPFVAVQRAMLAIARKTAPADVGLAQFRRSADRPLRRLEDSIAAAVLARLDPEQSDADHARPLDSPPRVEARLLARTAVAVLRTAANQYRDLQAAGAASPGVERLLRDTFATLARVVQPPS